VSASAFKAVKVHDGQAQVVPELCVACASCVRVCPQEAKSIRDDRPAIVEAIRSGRKVVASVATSSPAFFGIRTFAEMEKMLSALGFAAAGETAYGAEMVARVHREYVEAHPERHPIITSSCPVVVNLIERYYPDLIPHLAPLVSPMVAHGRTLRQRHGEDAYVVFIGPCIAKKQEMCRDEVADAIDAVLTFTELQEWIEAEGSAVRSATDDGDTADVQVDPDARLFPIEGAWWAPRA
jgi:iron only hydrogenase large subunit-like protein